MTEKSLCLSDFYALLFLHAEPGESLSLDHIITLTAFFSAVHPISFPDLGINFWSYLTYLTVLKSTR
jgi:hypothetical protein